METVNLASLADTFARRAPELVDEMMHILLEQIVELRGDEQVVGRLRASIESNVSAIQHLWEQPVDLQLIDPPAGALQWALLGYRLRGRHLGVILWDDASPDGTGLLRLQRLVVRCAALLRCQEQPLVVARDQSTVWAWLTLPPDAGADVVDTVTELLTDAGETLRGALGEEASGIEGVRRAPTGARRSRSRWRWPRRKGARSSRRTPRWPGSASSVRTSSAPGTGSGRPSATWPSTTRGTAGSGRASSRSWTPAGA